MTEIYQSAPSTRKQNHKSNPPHKVPNKLGSFSRFVESCFSESRKGGGGVLRTAMLLKRMKQRKLHKPNEMIWITHKTQLDRPSLLINGRSGRKHDRGGGGLERSAVYFPTTPWPTTDIVNDVFESVGLHRVSLYPGKNENVLHIWAAPHQGQMQ